MLTNLCHARHGLATFDNSWHLYDDERVIESRRLREPLGPTSPAMRSCGARDKYASAPLAQHECPRVLKSGCCCCANDSRMAVEVGTVDEAGKAAIFDGVLDWWDVPRGSTP